MRSSSEGLLPLDRLIGPFGAMRQNARMIAARRLPGGLHTHTFPARIRNRRGREERLLLPIYPVGGIAVV